MTDERPKFLARDRLAEALGDAIARLEELRVQGETLVDVAATDGSQGAIFERWRRQWEVSLDAVQSLCRLQAPLQFQMIWWPPKVDGAARLSALAGLMRTAAIGTRELGLLASQLVASRRGEQAGAQPPMGPATDDTSIIGTRYFRSGQRFEGAVEIRKLIQEAQYSIRIVDGYIAEETFILANTAKSGISRQFLMLTRRPAAMDGIRAVWPKWAGVWRDGGAECRAVGRPPLPHSRYLYVDGARYFFDASLKDVGRSLTHFRLLAPSEVRLVEAEVAAAWAAGVPLLSAE